MNKQEANMPSGSMKELNKLGFQANNNHLDIDTFLMAFKAYKQKKDEPTSVTEVKVIPETVPQTQAEKDKSLINDMKNIIKEMEEKAEQRLERVRKQRKNGE
jgi:hypothetical protein